MTDESLIAPKNPDGFTTESPIRAFTDFKVDGLYAIGKGFRPSLAHMAAYMSAMESKERWQLLQVILPRDNDGEPTMLFRKVTPPMYIMQDVSGPLPPPEDIYKLLGDEIFRGVTTESQVRRTEKSPVFAMPFGFQRTKDLPPRKIEPMPDMGAPHDTLLTILVSSNFGKEHESSGIYRGGWRIVTRMNKDEITASEPLSGPPTAWKLPGDTVFNMADMPFTATGEDDPIHPKHYDGTACCEIIDHMPTNVGLAGKYIWRLGEKDPIPQEIGKLIFYLKRQILLVEGKHAGFGRASFGFSDTRRMTRYQDYCQDRINARFGNSDFDVHRATAMTALVWFTTRGGVDSLRNAIGEMESILKIETGTGLAV